MKKQNEKKSGKLFQYDGFFYIYTGKIFDLFAVSVLWFLGCIPVITIGASFSALYAAVSKSICNDEGTIGSEFWKAYKRDLKDGVALWIGLAVCIFIILLNMGIVAKLTGASISLFLLMLYGACFIILVVAGTYILPALSKFDMPAGWLVKIGFYCTFRHFPSSIVLFAVDMMCYLLVLWQPVMIMIVPGAGCLAAYYIINPILQNHMPRE